MWLRLWNRSDQDTQQRKGLSVQSEHRDSIDFPFVLLSVFPGVPHQCMEGGHREDPQSPQCGFRWTAGNGQKAFRVG